MDDQGQQNNPQNFGAGPTPPQDPLQQGQPGQTPQPPQPPQPPKPFNPSNYLKNQQFTPIRAVEVQSSYDPTQNRFAAAPPPPKKEFKLNNTILIIAGAAIVLLALVATLIAFLSRDKVQFSSQDVINGAVTDALETKSYEEEWVIEAPGNNRTEKRTVEFSVPGKYRIHIQGLTQLSTNDTAEILFLDGDYYVKHHFSQQTIDHAVTTTQKQSFEAVNHRWVLVIKDNQPLKSVLLEQLGSLKLIQDNHALQPVPFLVGLYSEPNVQELIKFASEHSVYTPTSNEPENDVIGQQDAWKFKVIVNAQKAGELNLKAARMVGIVDPASIELNLGNLIPASLDLWVSKDTGRLLQYNFANGRGIQTVKLSKINETVNIPTADNVIIPPDALAQAEDASRRGAVAEISNGLAKWKSEGKPYPENVETFETFLKNYVPESTRREMSITYSTGIPAIGQIFYQPRSECRGDGQNIQPSDLGDTYTLLTRLAQNFYCADTVQ